MIKFAFNNTANISIDHTIFELNYKYFFDIFYKKNVNYCPKSKLTNKLLAKLWEFIIAY